MHFSMYTCWQELARGAEEMATSLKRSLGSNSTPAVSLGSVGSGAAGSDEDDDTRGDNKRSHNINSGSEGKI